MRFVYLATFIFALMEIVDGNSIADNSAYSIPITFPIGENINELPLLPGINTDTKHKIQATKTPIQRSSEAFSLQVFCVSCILSIKFEYLNYTKNIYKFKML